VTRNPLLQIQFAIPFDEIRPEHVVPAIEELLERSKSEIAAIGASAGPRTYDNTVGALERATETLEWAMGIVGHLESVATSDALRTAYNAVQPAVAGFYAAIPLDASLWGAVQAYARTQDAASLDATRRRHLTKVVADFRRHGAELDAAGKARLEALDTELARATTSFSQNVLDSTHAYELVIDDPADLAGLPHSAREAARESATAKGMAGWRFTLQAPSYIPLLTYLDDASIRERAYRAFNTRATLAPHDNRPLLREILALRCEKARLLGFASFTDLVLEDRMAKTAARALEFVDELREKTQEAFAAETADLLAFRRSLEGPAAPPLQPWDVSYYAEKQRKALYDFDDEALRPYFSAQRVIEGMFAVVERLYGVSFRENPDMPTWEPSVRCFDVLTEDDELLASFYVDVLPRETKRDGAWMHGLLCGTNGEPHLGLICANVTPPVGDRPALLTHHEVETLFHEFGHLMHHCLSRVSVRSLAGTNVAWDFVELPSQIMENWCWEREALDLFAHHHETGAPIPEALFGALRRARTFRAASSMMRQLGFAAADLALHSMDTPRDPLAVALDVARKHAPTALFDEYAMITSFTHLFAHPVGYAGGYYSYKWAEVLDADAFTRFRAAGIFDRAVGEAFRREILEPGDSRDAIELYRTFMGRDPQVEPLLERSGLLPAATSMR